MLDWSAIEWTWLRPLWLVALLPAIALLISGHFRGLGGTPLWLRWLSLLLRAGIVILLVLALVGVTFLKTTEQQMIVFAVDRSASVDDAARQAAGRYLAEAVEGARQEGTAAVRLLPFAREPGNLVDALPLSAEQLQAFTSGEAGEADDEEGTNVTAQSATANELAEAPRMATNIAAALRAAASSIPPRYVPRIVLLSDGNATAGDTVTAAAQIDLPIWTVPPSARVEPEVQLAAVDAPAQVRQGEPFYVDVIINANTATSGYVDLFRGDIRVARNGVERRELQPGENRIRFSQTAANESQTVFTARLRGIGEDDTLLDNNEATAIVHAQSPPRLLLLDPDVDQLEPFRWALEEQQINLDIRPPSGMPTSITELQRFDGLLLSNVPATALTVEQMDLIRRYVKDLGGGLVMLGGDQSFGLGGYYQTPLEQLLPVRSNFEKEREKPSLAMALVIDKSGSMGGERIALAKEAAQAAVELLGPRDTIGVIAFDGEAYWVSELRSASDAGAIIDRINTIDASGGTNMYPALDRAYQSLLAANSKVKHCIVLTDGQSSPADFEGLAADMAASRITLSTIALGDEASTDLLRSMARIGQGRYYFCNDPQSIPQVFAKETMEASKSALNELPFLPISIRPTRVLDGIKIDLAPFLLGYVVTRAKPTSEVILTSETGDPLLVWWRFGLGTTVAFTSDIKNRWASDWLAWPDFGPFWAQVIRHAIRKQESGGATLRIDRRQNEARVIWESIDEGGRFVNEAETNLTLLDPKLQRRSIALQLTAPGRYEATVSIPMSGAYQFELTQNRSGGEPLRQTRSIVQGYPAELYLQPVDRPGLRRLAEMTGGRFDTPPKQAIGPPPEREARTPIAAWPWLLMTALLLFVVDVAVRRLLVTALE